MTVRHSRGFSLMEIAIALALAGTVMLVIGALFIGSLNAWRRGQDLREAQAMAGTLVDTVARDIRGAGQAPNVVIRPQVPLVEGEALLAVAAAPAVGKGGSAWVVFSHVPQRRQVVRHIIETVDGRLVPTQSRLVASGVTRVTVEPASGGVMIEAEVRWGRATGTARVTAAPRNP